MTDCLPLAGPYERRTEALISEGHIFLRNKKELQNSEGHIFLRNKKELQNQEPSPQLLWTENTHPKYPAPARAKNLEGNVKLIVYVQDNGRTSNIRIHTSSGHEILDNAAIEAVTKWKFIPAKLNGTPVASCVVIPINFSLSK